MSFGYDKGLKWMTLDNRDKILDINFNFHTFCFNLKLQLILNLEYVIYYRTFLKNMEVMKLNKDRTKICWSRYTYIMKHQGCSRLTWRCTDEYSLKCHGIICLGLKIWDPQNGKIHSHIIVDKLEVNNFFINLLKYCLKCE